ncbi:Nucleotide-sugar uncharacterized transporter 2 [Vitis vinifera]|uniref:Nucleotide-sugar uncharacterized transporter 2 n=1 Tax=Vitis vinifera TaxID=29760 RepID=A0A438CZ63_VITVI|nr:Nucleotide-sugar uncharacterized transporter 2 [Vitis vinifera]
MLCSRKMLNFLIRKDVRKILKRKDSDAGEKGKAMEELRASLFNELRSSEGAKRQQQRICGPSVALTFNFLFLLVLGRVGFNYPIFLTFIHYTLSWLLMAILNALSMLPAAPPSKSTPFSSLLSLGIVMSLSNGLANVSLKYNSVGFYQMAKIAVTPTIVLAEFILFAKRVSCQKVLALTVVSIGVAVATVTDLQFHFFGACIALAWIIPSAVNKILWSNLQQQENWTALACPWLLASVVRCFSTWTGDFIFAFFFFSGIFLFLVSYETRSSLGYRSNHLYVEDRRATSATTHVVLGQFKTCVILLGGFFLFGSNPGTISICGATTALAGMSVYTYLNLLKPQQLPNKTSPRQNSFTLSKSKLSKENGDTHDGNNMETV